MTSKTVIRLLLVMFIYCLLLYGCGGGVSTDPGIPKNGALLVWQAPTKNVDGSLLPDLAGYRIYYGSYEGYYVNSIDVGNVTSYIITNLSPGTYHFVVTAYTSAGYESAFSNDASKTVE